MCGSPYIIFLNLTIVPLTRYQALEKVSKLEAENQSVEQVGFFTHTNKSFSSSFR